MSVRSTLQRISFEPERIVSYVYSSFLHLLDDILLLLRALWFCYKHKYWSTFLYHTAKNVVLELIFKCFFYFSHLESNFCIKTRRKLHKKNIYVPVVYVELCQRTLGFTKRSGNVRKKKKPDISKWLIRYLCIHYYFYFLNHYYYLGSKLSIIKVL